MRRGDGKRREGKREEEKSIGMMDWEGRRMEDRSEDGRV